MSVQEIRSARSRGVVAYTKFCLDKKYHRSHLFCFFEGEDSKYYNMRIERYTEYNCEDTIYYNCGGRKQVLKAYELIKLDNLYDKVKKAFFIDRDFDPISIDESNCEIYQTPCYSIENFYTSTNSFKKILSTEFQINAVEKDFEKCLDDYQAAFSIFHNAIKLFNAWIYYQRQQEKAKQQKLVMLNGYNILKLFKNICIDNVIVNEEINIPVINREFPQSYPLIKEEFDLVLEKIGTVNPQQFYRGKFEFQFLRSVIKDLKKKNCDKQYLSVHRTCVRIDVDSNPLSSLSLYADTPIGLISFLEQYRSAS
jgi:tetratricopeptide (TPR) repeat protein